ncbi:hypothetical protein E0H77_09775 [Acinetobacter sp. ANC 4633]|uniref:hypothetical protein n=1 Tax=Acinetobacter sp. ANC 4633 TaxID=2529845 RepID=UPI00103E34D1|nr:hypothetical protein [Acinetobacter sp. ANC 4633]TCB25347.1 hypothetical protein E0H77_09775 [Acinetobacter sp. ANC 4633]
MNHTSKITKISLQTLQKLEKPNANPTLDTMLKLCHPFGLKLILVKNDKFHSLLEFNCEKV